MFYPMKWVFARGALVAAVLMLVGCGQVGLGPRHADSAPVATAQTVPDFSSYAGQSYTDFTAEPGMERYSLPELGVDGTVEAQRFNHAMANPQPGLIAGGGGAEALVFSGCAPSGCLEGLSVVAIDVGTGDVFVGVSDMGGVARLAPNDRLEALLRLTSPSQSWDDPVRPPA